MASVHTAYGPGEVVETKTVRGRTEYRVAGNGFDVWLDGTKLGFAEVDHDNSVNLPYDPTPQYGVGALTDSTIQPIHEIDADERLSPSDSQSFDDRSESEAGRQPGPNPDLFAKSAGFGGIEGPDPDDHGDLTDPVAPYAHQDYHGAPTPHQTGPYGLGPNDPELREYAHPSMIDDDEDYGDEGPLQSSSEPWQGMGDQGHPQSSSVPWDQRNQIRGSYHQADILEGTPTRFEPNFIVNDTDDEFLHDEDVEADERESTGPDDIVHFSSRQHTAWAAAVPLLEEAAPMLARGVAGHEVGNALGGDEDASQNQGAPPSGADAVGNAIDQVAPDGHPLPVPDLEGTGWGSLTQKKGYTEHEAVDWQGLHDRLTRHPIEDEGGYEVLPAHEWLQKHSEPQEGDSDYAYASLRPAGLDARYADIYAAYDPYDKVAQFRHDPEAFINRVGHAEYEGLDPRMGSYVDMVDADEQLRTAAWSDVREKAMRLRREGRVDVHDVGDDRIYASVKGDHGTYDVMIKKGGAFGGFGGGHAITNWHCACEWGKWAFQRRFTFVGRLCSHGYASYLEMQSNHLKGKPQRRKTQPRRAQRVASDQTESDWTVDGNVPTSELNKLRDWAETDHDTWNGSQAEHNDDVRDAVEQAREEGVDADQLVASLIRHAKPEDDDAALNGTPFSPTNAPKPGGAMADMITQGNPGPSAGPATPAAPAPAGGGALPAEYAAGTPVSPENPAIQMPQDSPMNPGGIYTSPNKNTPDSSNTTPSGAGAGGGSNSYTVKPGDTLSGIAESHGGGDYNSITNQGGGAINNKDLITPGQKVDLSSMGGQGATKGWSQGGSGGGASGGSSAGWGMNSGGGKGSGAADTTAVTGVGGGAGNNLTSGGGSGGSSAGWGMGNSAGGGTKKSQRRAATGEQNPAATPGDPNADADPNGGADPITKPSTTPLDPGISKPLDPGAGGGKALAPAGGDKAQAGGIAGSGAGAAGGLGGFDMGGLTQGIGQVGDLIGQGMGIASDVIGGIGSFLGSRDLQADRDWFEAAYPDATYHDHKPFNGIGGENVTEWGQSKDNVKDNYADNFEDVTDEPKASFLTDDQSVEDLRNKGTVAARGITRAGHGPQRQAVEPVVVRERKGRNPAHIEAHVPDYADFDPLAPRTASSFDDPYAEQAAEQAGILAAANGNDIVRQFQAGGGGAINSAPQSQYDDYSDSPVFRQAMQRTAGRNYSLAEQAALVREGDRGGAGNLSSLQLEGTHYEAMNSVGLW